MSKCQSCASISSAKKRWSLSEPTCPISYTATFPSIAPKSSAFSEFSDLPTVPMLMTCSLDSRERLLPCSFALSVLNSPTAPSSSRSVGLPFDPSRSSQRQSRRMRLDGSERPYALMKTSAKARSQRSASVLGGRMRGLKATRRLVPDREHL